MNVNISKKSATQELTGNTGKKAFYGVTKRFGGTLMVAAAGLMVLAVVFSTPAWTQDKPADNMQLLRDKVKADKKLLMAVNMELTESEAKDFWPVYEKYQKELKAINQRIASLIESYAEAYRAGNITDEKAEKLTAELVAIAQSESGLQASSVPNLSKVLPPKKVARYLQIENKIRAAIKYDLAAKIPLFK
jgi:Spy/CpxP family protein refolding chaperone